MHPQLELLIQIQDLDLMIRELGNEQTASQEKKLGFPLAGTETLKEARAELAAQVDKEWLRRYERIATRYPRAIVPMREGICFGCFMRQPTRQAFGAAGAVEDIETCQRCGRVLFRLHVP